MSTNTTPDYLRGFLVPLDVGSENIWTAQSNFTTRDRIAGDPNPQQTTPFRIYATGQQTAASDITITTRRAGYAGFGAGFTFTDNQDFGTIYGRDPQNQPTRWTYIESSFAVSINYSKPYGMDAGDGDILIAYEKRSVGLGVFQVYVNKQTQDGTTTETLIYSQATTNTQGFYPVMCMLQNGEYLLAHIINDETDNAATIRTYTSTDGTTWTTRSREAIKDRILTGSSTGSGSSFRDHDIQNVQIAQTNGVILLMIETEFNDTAATKRNRLIQYASSDNGATFSLVTTDNEIDDHSFKSIALYASEGQFSFAYIGATAETHYMRIPSAYTSAHRLRDSLAYQTISTETVAAGSNDYMISGELAAWTDEDASHHVIIQLISSNGVFAELYSENFFDWRLMGVDSNGAGRVFNTGDASTNFFNLNALTWTGRSVVLCEPTTTSTNASILMVELGGYSTVSLPVQKGFRSATGLGNPQSESSRMSYTETYFGHDLFGNYSNLTAAAGTETLGADGVTIGSGKKYTRTLTTAGMTTSDIVGLGLIVRCRLTPTTGGGIGGSIHTSIRGIELTIDDTSSDYNVQVQITQTKIAVYDVNAGATAGSLTGLTLENGVEVLVGFSSGKIDVWYRQTQNLSANRKFLKALTITGLNNGGGGSSNKQEIVFGHLNFVSSISTAIQEIHIANGFNFAENLHGFSSPDDLQTRAYPTTGRYAYVTDNVSISPADGPTYEGDEYKITPTSNYPIDNIFHSVSPTPRVPWQSESVSAGSNVAEQFIAIKLDSDTSVHIDESLTNDIVGLHISNFNFRTAKLEYYSSGSWTVLDTFDCAIKSQGNTQGRTLRGVTGADNEPYLTYNECKDWYVQINTASGFVWRKIVSNSEGVFGGSSTTTKQAVLTLDQSVTSSTNATVYLVPKSFTLLVNLNGRRVEALGLRITTNPSYDDCFKIGTLVLGSVLIPGKQYQRGRSISINAGTETTEAQDGTRYARNQKPSQRQFRIAWTEGVDTRQLQGLDPTPDYWTGSTTSGAEPIAIDGDVPDLLLGLVSYLQGSSKPIVYLPSISKTDDTKELTRQTEQALVTLESDVTIEHVIGDELVSEVFRIATINLLEVV
mgnify:FL=1